MRFRWYETLKKPEDAVLIAEVPTIYETVPGDDDVLEVVHRRLWTCVICGKIDTWGSEWSNFTSLREEEEGYAVPICSKACRDKHREAQGRWRPTIDERGRVVKERRIY